MLTREDFRFNFFLLRVISSLGVLPFDVDDKHGILKVPKSQWKRYVSFSFFGLCIIHGCYIHLKLLQVLMNFHEIPTHHFVNHMNLCLAQVIIGWYLACFLLHSATFIALFNDVFTTANGGHDGFRARWKTHSVQDWLVLTMPTTVSLSILFVLVVFNYDRTMPFLLYASLPPEYKTPVLYRLLFAGEILSLTFIGINFIVVLPAQLLFFEKITGHLKTLTSSTKLGIMRVEQTCRQLRNIQLKVSLFNNINRFIVFSFKILCITMCTLNGYYMIAHFSADPLYGCVYAIVFWSLFISYSVMYERAHAIPTVIKETKSIVLLRVGSQVHAPGLKRNIEMKLRSVPAIGIQVGRFHKFERVATPVFLDFVVRNVMGVLVMNLNT